MGTIDPMIEGARLHKPTSEEKRIIRACAQRSAGCKRVEICASTRVNIEREGRIPDDTRMNVAFISDDPDFGDTDLFDNSYKWSDFTRGVLLTPDGRGVFDFWVYSVGEHAELKTNVTATYEGGRLVLVETPDSNPIAWKAAA